MMATNYSSAVEIKRIVKRYGEIWAVDNVDLNIRSGEIFGLLGPNGSGKSSTMKMLLGLVQPDSGALSVLGIDVQEERARAKNRSLLVMCKISNLSVFQSSGSSTICMLNSVIPN